MAYNGYPSYQPMYYQPLQTMQQPQSYQQPQTGIIWVSGEAGAKAYLVAPNTTVQLWDSETQSIYLKSADASGMPSIKILDYTIRDQTQGNGPVSVSTQTTVNNPDYATHAEITALAARIDALKAEIDGMSKKGASLNE